MVRSRKDASLRREEILNATTTLIETAGIHALRMSDVAAELGVSTALVVYHFSTKEQLIGEAFAWAAQRDLDRLEALTAGESTARERLRVAIEWYAPTGNAKGWALWIEGWAAALRDPALRQVGHEVDLRWKEALARIVSDGVAAGEFDVPDPRATAWRITALMDGLAVQTIVHRGLQSRNQAAAWVSEFVEQELGGSTVG